MITENEKEISTLMNESKQIVSQIKILRSSPPGHEKEVERLEAELEIKLRKLEALGILNFRKTI